MQRKFLVSGSNGKALYDLEKNKVFKLSEAEAEKFKKFSYKREDLMPFLKQNKELCLKHVNLELTASCNLRCKHCYGGKEFGRGKRELSTEQWKKAIGEIAEFKPGFILFTGGEALLRKDFENILLFTNGLGLNTSLFSNLTLLSDQQALALREANSIVQFSVYGHNPKSHDLVTCVKGSFEKQQLALKKLKEMGVRLRGQAILSKENLCFQGKIESLFKKQGIQVEFSIARPSGRQNPNRIPGCATCSFPNGCLEAEGSSASPNLDFFALKHFFNDCWIQRCGVTSQGMVLACVFARQKVLGDLTRESFKKVYPRIRENASEHSCNRVKECRNCSMRFACLDCRPWAFSLTGDWKAKNPYCKVVA